MVLYLLSNSLCETLEFRWYGKSCFLIEESIYINRGRLH